MESDWEGIRHHVQAHDSAEDAVECSRISNVDEPNKWHRGPRYQDALDRDI